MSHLHIPDGVLPPLVWIAGLLLALLGVAISALVTRGVGPQRIAFQSALGGIMLAVMAIPIPITAFDYCMTLAGPVGVLLGPASSFEACFVVTLILALMGQGGFTVIGLNALVLGLGAMLARPLYRSLVGSLRPPMAMAVATAGSQLASSLLWIAILAASVRLTPGAGLHEEVQHTLKWVQGGALALVLAPMLVAAVGIEALLALGLAQFLDQVRPDLLPRPSGEGEQKGLPS